MFPSLLQIGVHHQNQSSKDVALELMRKTHHIKKFKVYCNGLSLGGGVSVAAIWYKNDRALKSQRIHLGSSETLGNGRVVGISS